MKKYNFVVLTNAVAGREDEYNDWYDNQHLGDILRIPGFVGAKRFRATAEQANENAPPWRYLALYQIETDDLGAALAEMNKRGGGSAMPISEALDVTGAFATVFEAM
jgi:hypothetical protein